MRLDKYALIAIEKESTYTGIHGLRQIYFNAHNLVAKAAYLQIDSRMYEELGVHEDIYPNN
ncbi:hypothetical protein D3C78_1920530 [compost metagenome]